MYDIVSYTYTRTHMYALCSHSNALANGMVKITIYVCHAQMMADSIEKAEEIVEILPL